MLSWRVSHVWRGEQLRAALTQTYKARMTQTVNVLVGAARDLCPVRTGRLKASLTSDVSADGLRGWYGSHRPWRGENSVYYGVYQELGFRHYRSGKFIRNSFLRPPLTSKAAEIKQIWRGERPKVGYALWVRSPSRGVVQPPR